MKKLLVLILVTMFLAAGCFSSKKENPEPELTISTEGTVKMVDGATLKINVTSTKSESIPDEELEVVTNASRVDVYVNGVKSELSNGNLTLPEKTNNVIKFEAKRTILGEEFAATKEMTVIRTDVSQAVGNMIFPNNSTLYNSYGLAKSGVAGENKSTATNPVTELGNIVYRTVTTRDITDAPVVKAELQGVKALLPVTGLAGGDWANGATTKIYVVLNNSIVDEMNATVSGGYVEYKSHATDPNGAITIGKPLSTGLGTPVNYSLTEGENEIYLFVVNTSDTTKAAVKVGNGNLPIKFNVDTVRPTLTISTPLNNGYFVYTPGTAMQSVSLKASAKDTNWVYMYGTILKVSNTSDLTDTLIGTDANKLYKEGTGGTPSDTNWIKNETELELALTKLDMNVSGTANGSKDLLVLMAKDKNGNFTIRYVTISQAPPFTSDLSTFEVRDGTGDTTAALYNKYVDNMSITQSNISLRYTLQAGEIGSKVKVYRKMAPTSGNVPVEKPLTKELVPTDGNARILQGDYNLVTDFGFTTDELNKGELNMDLWLRLTDVSGTIVNEYPIKLRHITIDTLLQELKMSKDDLEFRTSADAKFNPLPNGDSSKIYFDDASDGDTDNKIDIGKIVITKPVNREYIIQIDGTTYRVDDSNTATFIPDIVMSPNRPTAKVNIYFREVSTANRVGSFDVVYMQDTNTVMSVDSVTIKQNKGKIELKGQINMPISVVNEYTFDVNMSNANGDMNLRATGAPVFVTYTANVTKFTVTADFNYDDQNATNYKFDLLKLNLKAKNDIILTTAMNINMDQVSDNNQEVYKIMLTSLEDDADDIWKITNYKQRVKINSTAFASYELQRNGATVTGFLDGDTVDLTGISSITVRGKLPNVNVYVERNIAVLYVTANAPTFANSDVKKQVKVIKETDNVMKVQGYVTNHKDTILKLYIDDVLLANPLIPEMQYISYTGTDTQYAYSAERPFITTDIGSPQRQGKDFAIKLEAYNTVDKISGFYTITDPTYYDTYAPSEYYPGKNGNGNRRFPDEWKGTNTTNSLDRFYVKYIGANNAELMVDDKPTEETYNNAVALGYIEPNLVMGNVQFTIPVKDAQLKMGFRVPESDNGYFAVIQNQTGDSDYIIGRVPVSESDADYTTINSAEPVIVVINLDGDITELTVGTDGKTTGGAAGSLQQDNSRGFLYKIGDNKYKKVTISLKDKHSMETTKYTFINTNYSPITSDVAYADIVEGEDKDAPVGRVVISQIPNLKGTTVALYRDVLATEQIFYYTNEDLTVAVPPPYDISGVKGGDKVYLRVKDKYGNSIENGYLTLTVQDKVPPLLPAITDITSDKTVTGATTDKLTFNIEAGAEAFIIQGNNIKQTYAEQKAQNIAKITYTDIKDSSGNISGRKVVAEVPRSKLNKDLFLTLADSSQNLTTSSKFTDNKARQISSLVVYSYDEQIPSDVTILPVNSATTPYALDESINISWTAITNSDTTKVPAKYRITFVKSGETDELFYIEDTKTSIALKMDDIVTKYKVTPFNLAEVNVYVSGISKQGIEGPRRVAPNPVKMDLLKPDLAGFTDMTKVQAQVSYDNVIYFKDGSFDRTKAGLGMSGDNIYIAVYNTTSGKYDEKLNSLITKKVWPSTATFLDVEGVGAIENNTVFFVRIIDEAGNVSTLPTTQTSYLISATDDEAPKASSYLKVAPMIVQTGNNATVAIKYDVPTTIGEGDYVEVLVIAYSDANTKPDASEKQIGYVRLSKTNGYAVGGTTGLSPLKINFGQHPEGLAVPDAAKVFIRMRDSKGNTTSKINEVRLQDLIDNNPLN